MRQDLVRSEHDFKGRVLLVDDDQLIIRALERALSRDGYEIMTASTGAAAAELAETQDIDVIVSDIAMPDGTGIDLLKHLRSEDLDTVTYMDIGLCLRHAVLIRVAGGQPPVVPTYIYLMGFPSVGWFRIIEFDFDFLGHSQLPERRRSGLLSTPPGVWTVGQTDCNASRRYG